MKIPVITTDMKLIAGAAVVAGLALWWFARNGNAKSVGTAVGGAAVDLITGTVVGVAQAVGGVAANVSNATVAAANDPSVNPLQPFGSWLGQTAYDLTHSKASGGMW